MKNIHLLIALIVACFSYFPKVYSDQLISLFLRPYPSFSGKMTAKAFKSINYPNKIARRHIKTMLSDRHAIEGIFATYAGYLTVSDANGQIMFPRKHQKQEISLLITSHITPVVRSGNTLSHWEINFDYPAHMYKIIQKKKKAHLEYFETTTENLPKNGVIPLDCIVIIANPKFIYVPLGVSLAHESPHLILPQIFVKKGIMIDIDALYILNVMHYFGLLKFLSRKESKRYITHLTY